MEFNFLSQFRNVDVGLLGFENSYAQGAAFFTESQLGERLLDPIDECARKRRLSRRTFLKTASGFAAALYAVNKVTGLRLFDVSEAAAVDEDAAREALAGTEFIIDAHTHVAWRQAGFTKDNTTERGMWFVDLLDTLGKTMGLKNGIRDMDVEGYGRTLYQESDTAMALVNPFGFREDYGGHDMNPIEEVAQARARWPERTILLGGGLTPNQGLSQTLERLDYFAKDMKIQGLKLYTFDSTVQKGWWFDDEKLAYPIWEQCRRLGIKNIGCHKGIPFGQFMARYAHPEDFDRVADDFLDLNWIAFHSAWPYHQELAALKSFKPQRQNLYCELGSVFAATVTNRPLECAHVLGTLLRDLGPDSILWGTDSPLWGVAQWQIDAFRKFQIPDQLVEGHGYPQLTEEMKRKIFGQNAARLWGINTEEKKRQIQLRKA
jgi:uncharacterized protein